MSKIVVLLDPSSGAQVLRIVRDATSDAWGRIAERVRSQRPAAEFILFPNNHHEVAARLRQLISQLTASGIVAEYLELSPDEEFKTSSDLGARRLSPKVIENILRAHEEEIARIESGEPD